MVKNKLLTHPHLVKDKLLDTQYQNFVSLPLSGEVETISARGATCQ
ncbi:hypothetical protein EZS27_033206 [termite gut metagenome]|uniref:Uncharacterized protein n=1 Tax=termite gut metagenome TaxID=433724 RepID=A0A5J4Q7D6_9ZZZZ